RVELAFQLLRIAVHADMAAGLEDDPFLTHQREPALEKPLLQLERRNAVAKQATDAIGALEDRDVVAGAVQLIGCRQARPPGANDGDALAGAGRRRLSAHPAFRE